MDRTYGVRGTVFLFLRAGWDSPGFHITITYRAEIQTLVTLDLRFLHSHCEAGVCLKGSSELLKVILRLGVFGCS